MLKMSGTFNKKEIRYFPQDLLVKKSKCSFWLVSQGRKSGLDHCFYAALALNKACKSWISACYSSFNDYPEVCDSPKSSWG